MQLTQVITEVIKFSEQKVIATTGVAGINVIPLSMVEVVDDHIIIYDCFMSKTRENLATKHTVAMGFWSGFVGVQVKGEAEYHKDGPWFEQSIPKLAKMHPDRTLVGVIVVTPSEVYDLAPGTTGAKLA